MMNVAVIGTGYVGLVTGVVLSEIGHTVTCIDIDEIKVKSLKSGKSPIYEPGLDELMARNIEKNRLSFTMSHKEAFKEAEIVFIAVGTPQSESGAPDLSYIKQAAKDIALNIIRDTIVVVKSTVPVGTNDLIKTIIEKHLIVNARVDIVSNPEFLREGFAIHDTFHADRIVIGAESEVIGDKIEQLYKALNLPIIRTNRRSAEMIKYAANAFLAVKISYINEIANLCEKVGVNVLDVADGMGMDHRIGRAFLNPGLGYGGSCFPKDTEAIAFLGRENGNPMTIIESAIKVNFRQQQLFLQKVLDYFNDDVTSKTIGILGLAFKPNTDDLREAPSIYLIEELEKRGALVKAYDPVVKHLPCCVGSVNEVIETSEVILLVTEWNEFKEIVKEISNEMVVFDGRYILEK